MILFGETSGDGLTLANVITLIVVPFASAVVGVLTAEIMAGRRARRDQIRDLFISIGKSVLRMRLEITANGEDYIRLRNDALLDWEQNDVNDSLRVVSDEMQIIISDSDEAKLLLGEKAYVLRKRLSELTSACVITKWDINTITAQGIEEQIDLLGNSISEEILRLWDDINKKWYAAIIGRNNK